MKKGETLTKIRQMTITEKMARLPETAFIHVEGCVEKAVPDEQKQPMTAPHRKHSSKGKRIKERKREK